MEYTFGLSSLLVLVIGIVETTSFDPGGVFEHVEAQIQTGDDDQSGEGSDNARRRRHW